MAYGEKKLGGGHAASHAGADLFPILVATATGSEKNVIREELTTVACWRLDDLRFDFNSAFVSPEAKDEFAELRTLRDAHPGSPLSVFGHADPVGDEEYNKGLSDRRSEAIYAVLVRDPARWEKLYGSDGWTTKHTQIMLQALGGQSVKEFQSANGLNPDGAAGPATRAKLFEKYMEFLFPQKLDKTEFLGKGADSGGKGDFQGCSEFNPAMVFSKAENTVFQSSSDKTKRNEENTVNRRVMALFFRPGTLVPIDKWPCPRASEGTTNCRRRFWSDQAARRSNTETRREFAATRDTFACRFYHRLVLDSPCEHPGQVTPPATGDILVTWSPAKVHCGDTATMTVETAVPGISSVHAVFTMLHVAGTTPPPPVDLPLTDGKATWKFEVKDIGFLNGADFVVQEEMKAVVTGGSSTGEGILKVDALIEGPTQSFDETRTWSGFTNHSRWKQRIEKFENKVDESFNVRKAWGATKIDLTGFVTGKAGGCPEDNHRWGRSINLNQMAPDEYYDGTAWVPLPAGFTASATNYFGSTFTKSGTKFNGRYGGTWPEAFADYDFNNATYTKKRADWCQRTHDVWTDQFHIRRKNCKSAAGVRCCVYTLDVQLTLTEVTSGDDGVLFLAPGGWRSDSANWAMDDPDLQTAAHEAGHLLDNPDEYLNGGVDPAVNGDGAVNGIDDDSIMGQNLTVVKKRHYGGMITMNKRIIKTKYGLDYDYEAVDK